MSLLLATLKKQRRLGSTSVPLEQNTSKSSPDSQKLMKTIHVNLLSWRFIQFRLMDDLNIPSAYL